MIAECRERAKILMRGLIAGGYITPSQLAYFDSRWPDQCPGSSAPPRNKAHELAYSKYDDINTNTDGQNLWRWKDENNTLVRVLTEMVRMAEYRLPSTDEHHALHSDLQLDDERIASLDAKSWQLEIGAITKGFRILGKGEHLRIKVKWVCSRKRNFSAG